MSGGEKYMLTMATCLAQSHDVSIFWDKTSQEEIKDEAKRKFDLDLSSISFTPNIFDVRHSLLSRIKESRKYDAIIVLSDGSIPFVACKLILHFQSPVEWVQGNTIKTKVKLRNVHEVICNSEFTKSFIDKKFHINSTVLYPPVTVSLSHAKTAKENVILNVGRYGIKAAGSSYKKQEVMIETFKNMVDSGLNGWKLELLVSTFDPNDDSIGELQKLAKGYPIVLKINTDNKHLWESYAKAKIYWHAAGFGEDLQKHPDRAEHFGISTVEAMGMGVVPIVINAGGQPEIVQDGESGFLWSTEKELIDKTLQVIKNNELREKLAKSAKQHAPVFYKEHFCQKLGALMT